MWIIESKCIVAFSITQKKLLWKALNKIGYLIDLRGTTTKSCQSQSDFVYMQATDIFLQLNNWNPTDNPTHK